MAKGVEPIAQGASEALSAAIDTLGMTSAMVEAQVGAATGTPDSYAVAVAVKECATSGGSYAAVSGATASLTTDGDHAQIRVEGLGTSRLRYLKVSMTPSFVNGTSPKALIGSSVILAPLQLPASNSSTQA